MMKLNLMDDKSVDEADVSENENEPAEDENNGTMVLKELLEP